MKTFLLKLDESLHREIKKRSADADKTMNDFITAALEEKLQQTNINKR